ncbi:MAG: DUF5689 domain-containing protein [Prevotella sp.]|nr:DUF5689 domain-containing protein [Prevotella sp.]
MKIFHSSLFMLALACSLLTSCMDGGWGDPNDEQTQQEIGNKYIKETHLVTISQLKQKFKAQISTDYRDGVSYKQVTEDLQIKGYVTGNDIGDNIFDEVVIQDATGAIIVAVSEGAMYGYLPIGAEVLIDVKGLYVGNYGMQAEIGVPSTNSKKLTYVSRMSRDLWRNHFRLTGGYKLIEPEVFADGGAPTNWKLDEDGGKLGVIKNVTFRGADGKATFANPSAGAGSKSVYFNEYKGNTIQMYNSNYAKFAANTIPTGKVNVTAIVKRFNSGWEFVVRDINDIQEVK